MAVQVHHDERSAAFVGLGLSIATGVPTIVLTTSGTAAVEMHPAVVEAHHAGVPLLAVTADRPPELVGVGAPQTIDQTDLYSSTVQLQQANDAYTSAQQIVPQAQNALGVGVDVMSR